MTYKELKSLQRKDARDRLKQVEKILHPCPIVEGIEILHEHIKGTGAIRFSGYTDKLGCLGGRYIEYDQNYVLSGDGFYEDEKDNMYWLATGQDKAALSKAGVEVEG